MLKKILIGALSTLVVSAVGVSAYNTTIKPAMDQVEPQVVSAAAAVDAAPGLAVLDTVPSQVGQANQVQGQWGAGNGQGNPAVNNSQLATGQGQTVSGGQGRGNRFGAGGSSGRGQAGQANNAAVPEPQNGLTDWLSVEGTVSQVAYPNFTLTSPDGETLFVSLGNLNYAASLGIDLTDGEQVSLTGFWDTDGTLAVGSLQADNQTYLLRDDYGRPLWSGGASH